MNNIPIYDDPQIVNSVIQFIEFLGTFTFAVSGIRHAAAHHFDWFGGFVCGVVVAVGGGTLRDVMLGVTPFWMTSPFYICCALLAQVFVLLFSKVLKRLDNAWFVFDTLGLGLFTIAGLQKTIDCGHPLWIAIFMGCVTGSAGGVIRDILLNRAPLIFQKEIYAMASVAGGLLYSAMMRLEVNMGWSAFVTFMFICLVRFLALRYHISLPTLKEEDEEPPI